MCIIYANQLQRNGRIELVVNLYDRYAYPDLKLYVTSHDTNAISAQSIPVSVTVL